MKAVYPTLALAFLGVSLTNSQCTLSDDGIKASKNRITRDYKVDNFNKIDACIVGDISYTQTDDGSSSLQIYGSDNMVDLMVVDIQDSTLILSMKKRNIKKSDLKITISSPGLNKVYSKGVGKFTIKDSLKTTVLEIHNEGVGDVQINNIVCSDLKLYIEGVGNARVNGKAENVVLSTQGVGNIEAENLEGDNVKAVSEGIGSISCYAIQSINAITNGIGNITYKGNPANRHTSKNGIGSIKKK